MVRDGCASIGVPAAKVLVSIPQPHDYSRAIHRGILGLKSPSGIDEDQRSGMQSSVRPSTATSGVGSNPISLRSRENSGAPPALSLMTMACLRPAVSLGLVLLSQERPTRGRIGIGRVSDLTARSRSLRDFRRDGDAGCKHGRRATARGPNRHGTTVGAMSLVEPASQA
jgi:hypothetical protein